MRNDRQNSSAPVRSGFTLLELFLTLSLAVVLMTLINSAFRFYARDMDSSDVEMRKTMLAAAVIQMIEDDLRASLHSEPIDTSALATLLSNSASAGGGGAGGGGGGGGGSTDQESQEDMEAAGMDDPALAEEEPATVETLTAGTAVLQSPGLIGNQYQIQMDTSRLPRLEEYNVLLDADPGNLADLPSDVKTVTYYVQGAGNLGVDDSLTGSSQAVGDPSESGESGGLVRRVLDRAATAFAITSGNVASLGQTGEVIAPEITSIEFSYWDGVTWQIQWNSDELGELPLAVQIEMTMAGDSALDAAEQEPRVFRHVVQLPLAQPITLEETDTGVPEAGI
ncbi:prepilin-type cleavage/methylation domain-containing protein [Roseiconus nitratireducens]|uniref:Prepilin-type cleavage/methylation domain-containing protein n=1 Tax=Roseiconus nitratireducens TaxID=2605748 RepID=A0A5M6D7X8_9BACT|nr:prepilin-type cleavage/methylation domain-containing protein [Roseiconus nitratireducens]KAA5543658.1 prepilin-type cleavage/methylation domain-containing protein [Roseiconus nitratireducens]